MRNFLFLTLLIALTTVIGCKDKGSPPGENAMDSKEMTSDSNSMAPESKEMASESGEMPTESKEMTSESTDTTPNTMDIASTEKSKEKKMIQSVETITEPAAANEDPAAGDVADAGEKK